MIFEGNEVEVLELNGEALFNPYHVGECLDIADVKSSIRNYNKNQIVKVKTSDVHNMHFRKLNNTGENFLTESGVYKLIFKSRKPNAEKFTDWIADEVLPSIRKTGTYSTNDNQVTFKEQVECVGVVADILRVNDASKLYMIEGLYKSYNLPTAFLPKYEFNGSREMKSATELLKRYDLGMTARSFNLLLCEYGYLEEKERNSGSSKSGVKKYKALTEKGLKYGENAVSLHNQREVQPLYYADTFEELYNIIVREVA